MTNILSIMPDISAEENNKMESEPELESEEDEYLTSEDEAIAKAFKENKLGDGLCSVKPFVKREFKNDVVGMKQALESFKSNLPWIETLDHVTDPAPITAAISNQYPSMDLTVELPPRGKTREKAEKELAKDDFKREMLFYRQAQASVLHCIPLFHTLGVVTKRPEDYFAQMVKSDEHMKKIREKLLTEHLTIQRKEKAKHLRENKMYSKQVQRETLQQRQRQKKAMQKAVKLHNKGKKQNLDAILNPADDKKQGGKKSANRREFKNKKFGMGGKKRGTRRNDAASSGDIGAFSMGKHTDKKRKKGGKGKQKVSKRK